MLDKGENENADELQAVRIAFLNGCDSARVRLAVSDRSDSRRDEVDRLHVNGSLLGCWVGTNSRYPRVIRRYLAVANGNPAACQDMDD